MKLGKRTAKLLREAIVLAHVEGSMWGQANGRDATYPKDSDVVRRVLVSAARNEDLYPTLSKLDETQAADAEHRRASAAFIAAIVGNPTTNEGA